MSRLASTDTTSKSGMMVNFQTTTDESSRSFISLRTLIIPSGTPCRNKMFSVSRCSRRNEKEIRELSVGEGNHHGDAPTLTSPEDELHYLAVGISLLTPIILILTAETAGLRDVGNVVYKLFIAHVSSCIRNNEIYLPWAPPTHGYYLLHHLRRQSLI